MGVEAAGRASRYRSSAASGIGFGSRRSRPKAEDMEKLPWAKAVFQEAMRLYPPVWYMGRVAIEGDDIDGYMIPRGACVMVMPWFTHRHRDFWARRRI